MFERIVSCGVIVIVLVSGIRGKLPADVKACKAGDKVCLVDTINNVIATKYNGNKELNLVSIDPLNIPEMRFTQSGGSNVDIDVLFKNNDLYGFRNSRVLKVRGFGASPEGKHGIFLKGPSMAMIGSYSAKGRVLLLPIQGQGQSNITVDNFYMKVFINAGSVIKDGLTYMDVKNVIVNFNTTRMHFHFSNLFNGDPVLTENMNVFVNENWNDIYLSIKGTIENNFGTVYTNFIRKVFASQPYSDLLAGAY